MPHTLEATSLLRPCAPNQFCVDSASVTLVQPVSVRESHARASDLFWFEPLDGAVPTREFREAQLIHLPRVALDRRAHLLREMRQ